MKMERCLAVDCRASIRAEDLFCERHVAMLQPETLAHLKMKFRPHELQSQAFYRLLDYAREEILFVQDTGHAMPVDRRFEW